MTTTTMTDTECCYLLKLNTNVMPKNRLHKEVIDLLKSLDRLWVSNGELPTFFYRIKRDIELINANNPRCNPIMIDDNIGATDPYLYFGFGLDSNLASITFFAFRRFRYNIYPDLLTHLT